MKMIITQNRSYHWPSLPVLLVLLLIPGLLAGCITGQTKVPGISSDNPGRHLEGKFIWYDLFTIDVTGSAEFYSELFGWAFETVPGSQARIQTILLDGVPIGNAVEVPADLPQDKNSQWLSYMSTGDVDESVRIIEKNHGTVQTAPRELPDRGRVAVVRDPQGAQFALLHSSAGDPTDGELKHSSWIGSELWTADIREGVNFYSQTAGYEESLVPLSCGDTYHFLMKDGLPRAGIAKIPWDGVEPNWVPYISVENVAAVAAKAVTLGATLIMEPDGAFPENEVAVIADPSGAVFGIQQIDLNFSPKGNEP